LTKGTFGQTIPWNLYDPATYQHPSVPLDVLTDPRSLPKNQQTKEEEEKNQSSVPVGMNLFVCKCDYIFVEII
jgi:hypothetical protein